MRAKPSTTIAILSFGSLFGFAAPASAACTFYNLTNGSTADATQVMADFNCLQGNVEIDNGSLVLNGYEWSQGPNAGYAFWDRANANNAWTWYSSGNTAYLWKNFNTAGNVVSVDQNGHVGIGTSTPDTQQLLTLDKATSYGGVRFRVAGTNVGQIEQEAGGNIYYDALTDMYLRPGNGATAMVLKANGYIGIGTSSPGGPLDVRYTSGIGCMRTGNANNQYQDVALCWDVGGQTAYLDTYGYSYPINIMDGTIHVEPGNRSGKVGIGTITPSYTLHVNGSVAGTSAYNNLSDFRLKKNVQPITYALNTIMKLRGVRFSWRSPQERAVGKKLVLPLDSPQIGFIAQEVKKVIPEAVTVAQGDEAIMSMQESKIVPVLVEAMKELKAENDRQAATVAKLERDIAAMQSERHVASNETLITRAALALGWR